MNRGHWYSDSLENVCTLHNCPCGHVAVVVMLQLQLWSSLQLCYLCESSVKHNLCWGKVSVFNVEDGQSIKSVKMVIYQQTNHAWVKICEGVKRVPKEGKSGKYRGRHNSKDWKKWRPKIWCPIYVVKAAQKMGMSIEAIKTGNILVHCPPT